MGGRRWGGISDYKEGGREERVDKIGMGRGVRGGWAVERGESGRDGGRVKGEGGESISYR